MARRNRKSRKAAQGTAGKNVKPTEEELNQERSFFMWAGGITLIVVLLFYFFLF